MQKPNGLSGVRKNLIIWVPGIFFVQYWKKHLGRRPHYAGRTATASPATGSLTLHKIEQAELIADALNQTQTTVPKFLIMSTEVKIPALGESISSGVLSSWKVAEGSYVDVDQPIYELETDKITQEGLAEVAGVISFTAKEGEEVEIGATIANIDESAEKSDSSAPAAEEEPVVESADAESKADPKLAPTAVPVQVETDVKPLSLHHQNYLFLQPCAKFLAETQIDPATLSGTGKDGRITKADVLNAQKATPEPFKRSADCPYPTVSTDSDRKEPVAPLSPIRRKIASRLVEAQQTAAILSTFNEVDLTEIMALRKRHQDSFVKQNGVKLGFMSFFVKGVVHALRAVPQINSRMEGNELVENHYFDIGVAVGTEKGLVVPVLRDCDNFKFCRD